jgi:tetratricopeptide (TPR) repeat protein
MKTQLKTGIGVGLVPMLMLGCGMILPATAALAQSNGSTSQQSSGNQGNKPQSQQEANPFPEDTNTVPVLPSGSAPVTAPDANDSGSAATLPGADSDPVHSPDDAAAAGVDSGSSSSDAGLDNLLKPPPDEEQKGKHQGKHGGLESNQPHPESAKEDESVGSYYLDQKNWKAALSRYESAVVLDPENPDVYWGLAEAQRHSGDYANAKANYQKVMEYDPDSKHSKEAKKLLQQPEMANAKAVSSNAAPQ